MAAEILTSDLITAYKNKQRVRTMNSAGSVICTTATDTNVFLNKDKDSVLHVALIPVSAVIHRIIISFSEAIAANKGIINIGFYGIHKRSQDLVEIKKDVETNVALSERSAVDIIPTIMFGKTVYEILCSNGTPIEQFEPFKDSEYLVLSFTIVTKNEGSTPTNTNVQVLYTHGAPSTTSLTKLTLDKE